MKVLFVQLARLGDIYQTWPAIHASLRADPDSEIHLLVRERFQGATMGLDERVRVHTLPTASILGPLLRDSSDHEISQHRLGRFLDSLVSENFDLVINLSFSPFSSYLSHFIESEGADVRGYTRHSDGFFNPIDDIAAYFYGQVGVDRWNRFHLTEIFASMAGVELKPEDWHVSKNIPFFERVLPSKYVVFHMGASQRSKAWSSDSWCELILKVIEETEASIVLVGSDGEDLGFEKILKENSNRILNLVGKTRVSDLLLITKWAEMCVGGDSVVMHAASLTNTPCLNLSSQSVNFWETGPCSQGSEVIWAPKMEEISPTVVFSSLTNMLHGYKGNEKNAVVLKEQGPVKYRWLNSSGTDFEWNLIQSLYTGLPFPMMDDPVTFQAFYRLRELSDLAIQIIQKLDPDLPSYEFVNELGNVDNAIEKVALLNTSSGIIVRWLFTEKIRIQPQSYQTLVERTRGLYADLNKVCRVFVGNESYHFDQGEIYAE